MGVAGHRDTFFRPLRFLRNTDLIKLTTHDREYLYRVTSIAIVPPDDVTVLSPKGRETLTLVTCYPFTFVGAAPKRFIATAFCADRSARCLFGDDKGGVRIEIDGSDTLSRGSPRQRQSGKPFNGGGRVAYAHSAQTNYYRPSDESQSQDGSRMVWWCGRGCLSARMRC